MPAISYIDYSILPSHMREGAKRYIEEGIFPGSFLTHIFENDFVHAAATADPINQQSLYNYAEFLYTQAPSACWGSASRMQEWSAHMRKEKNEGLEQQGDNFSQKS
jgi:hypothetical protein